MHTRLQFECLETRELLSATQAGAKLQQPLHAPAVQSAVVRSPESLSSAISIKSMASAAHVSPAQRWDQILLGTWYVPPANTLAYLVGPAATDPLAIADETIFQITTAHNGAFSGTCTVQLAKPTPQGDVLSSPSDFTLQGVVTPQGNIRVQFTPTNSQEAPVTGVGIMESVNHAWRMTMQMASSGDLKVFHWAYMTKLPQGQTVPLPVVQPLSGDLGQGKWLLGTRWVLVDSSGITEQFVIDGYRKGYFTGRGLGKSSDSLIASVTPEGHVLLLLSSPDGTSITRTGTLKRLGKSALMQFRSYESSTAVGVAVQIATDAKKHPHNRLVI